MSEHRRIAVAMSGGVDSSVAAALLVETGADVFGIMLRLWSEDPGNPNRCCSPDDMTLARGIAAQLGIPFYVLDARQRFKLQVVDFFLDGYAQGITPNPCMECNRHVRWDYLFRHALAMGATHLATGHYARVRRGTSGLQLLRALDRHKDQSYVLSVLGQHQLARALFPLGEYSKAQVREHARRLGLPVAERAESQDLCFTGEKDYRDLLARHKPDLPPSGPILDAEGEVLGQHTGLANYTIGQRKGLGISAPQPLYVIEKQIVENALVVGPKEALGRREFIARRTTWVSGRKLEEPIRVSCRVRYKAPEVSSTVRPLGDQAVEVTLEEAVRDVTPGQAAVFYEGDTCLGGGIISQ